MLNLLKYIALGVFVKRNKFSVLVFLCLGLFLTIFLLFMSDIKPHLTKEEFIGFLIIKWTVFFSIIIVMSWLLYRMFKLSKNKLKKEDPATLPSMRQKSNQSTSTRRQPKTRGDVIKEKYRSRINGQD